MASIRPPHEVALRRRRAAVVAAVAAVAVLGAPAVAAADGSSPGGSLSDQAAALVTRIQAEDLQADQLSEQVDQARIQVAQIAGRLQADQGALAATAVALGHATSVLSQEVIAAYMQDGRPLTYVAHDTADDPALIAGYASSVAGVQQNTIAQYEALRSQQSAQAAALSNAEAAASASAEQLGSAQQQAQQAADQAQATLTQVQSQATLAALVTRDQATQAVQTAQTVATRYGVTSTGVPLGATPAAVAAPAGSSATAGTTSGTTGRAGTSPAPVAAPAPAAPATTRAPAPFGQVPAPTTAAPVTQAPTTQPPATTPRATTPPTTAAPAPASGVLGGASTAIAYAEAQIGKPYAWGGAGPDSFDCSGLVMRAWGAAGVSFPHSSQDQYDMTERVAIASLEPGDLVFFGTPSDVYHVGIYVGGGEMVDAPHTGADVRTESIYWSDLLAGGRVT